MYLRQKTNYLLNSLLTSHFPINTLLLILKNILNQDPVGLLSKDISCKKTQAMARIAKALGVSIEELL